MAERRLSLANGRDTSENSDLIDLNSPVRSSRRRRLFEDGRVEDAEENGVEEEAEDKENKILFDAKNNEVVYEACGSYVNTYRRSPVMSSSMMEDAHGSDGEILTGSVWPRSSSFLDLSRISNISLEALAGNSNSELENGQPDFQAEISDLNLRLQKQNDDNASLKNRLTEAQEDYFNVLQNQRDELDKKSSELKGMNERVKRLERELNDKNQQISSLEDRNTVLYNRITRLENECSMYHKERKELYLEIEELKGECRKTLTLFTKQEEEKHKIEVAAALADQQWNEKVKWLNDQVEPLKQTIDELSQRIEELQLEKLDLESQNKRERGIDHYQSPGLCQLRELSHLDSFDVMDVSSDDIETELLVAEGRFPPDQPETVIQRFDVAIQCGNVDQYKILEQDVNDLYALVTEISEMLYSIRHTTLTSSSTGNDDELCKVDQIPNGSGGGSGEPISKSKKKKNKGEQVKDAQQGSGGAAAGENKESDLLSESNATVVVRQINQELAEFREQLKKSQELFSVLRFNSTQSISLTKSCPGLTVDPSDPLSKSSSSNHNNKAVSCGTQTDSPVIETPVLAQKLALRSASNSAEHSHHHHHHLNLMMSGGGLPDFMTNDSMDNPSFDKLSDDGSVRVRDDLSMVLEVSEQETETSPGAARRTMSFDKGSINRPKLTRMPNATEEEEPHCSNSNHHHNHNNRGVGNGSNSDHLAVEDGITSDNDYETITPLDGDRTPVNEEIERPYHSSTEICSASYRRSPFMGSPSQSEPSDYRRMGVIPQSELPTMLQNAFDPVGRATNPHAKFLSNDEWQQLRQDQDLNDQEAYRKQFAQEEGNEEDGGASGVEGVPQKSNSAFALDEEAEKYLGLLPNLVEELFQTFDVMRDKKQAPTKEDLEDLERKFNHMAEVFQTDHTNLDQRITALSKDYKESQLKLKEFSQSLKSSISRLKEISKSNGTVPEDLLDVIKTLNSTSEEFEMYSDTMRRISRRMGMMDVQNRLHKMLDVMILYVHIIRTNFDNLQTDYIKAKKLLEENNVAFSGNRALGPLQNNNNNDEKCLWDEEELENSHSDRCDDGDSEPEKILQHLLGPKKSSAGLSRKERPILKEKRSSDSLLVRCMAEGYEVLRRELFWPWNMEQTIKGLKQGFSVILMILGLFVFLRGFLPSVSAIDDGCVTNPSFFKSMGEYFSYCGDLSHNEPPII